MSHKQGYRQNEQSAGCPVLSIVPGICWPNICWFYKTSEEGRICRYWALKTLLWGIKDRR